VPHAFAQAPAGGEFRVPVQAAGPQFEPSSASGSNGDFVVVWTQGSPAQYDVYGRRFSAAGAPLGTEFRVNTYTTGIQRRPTVGVDDLNRFVVFWQDLQGTPGLFAQRYEADGSPVGTEFRVTSVTGTVNEPRAAVDRSGRFVVTWWGSGAGDNEGIFARRFDYTGAPAGADFLVNAYTTGRQESPALDVDAAGNFTVAWESAGQDGSFQGIFARRVTTGGLGPEFRVNTYTLGDQRNPAVAMGRGGQFVVLWDSLGQDGSLTGVYAQRYDPVGVPLAGEFRVNEFTTGSQAAVSASSSETGAFVASWSSDLEDGSSYGVFARRFDSGGTPRGPEFRVNTYTTAEQLSPSVASDLTGNFVVSWMSFLQDGSDFGVYAQRYGGLVPQSLRLDTTGNAVLEPGETVDVRPSWRNVNGAAQSFTASLSGGGGPVGGPPIIVDGSSAYGPIANGATAECADCYSIGVANPVPRPAQHWDVSFAENVAPVAQGQQKVWFLHVGRTFPDVPATSPFYRFIETALHNDVMVGCDNLNFCPTTQVTRDYMASYVLIAHEPLFVPPACVPGQEMFLDVPAANGFCPWIEELARRGVVAGCGGGNYCPGLAVSRETLAVYLLKTKDGINYFPQPCGAPIFNDVPASSPFCPWVEELWRRGVVTGCGNGNYCPVLPVSREQMSVFVSVTFGLVLYGP
jgi:hypothetical protein